MQRIYVNQVSVEIKITPVLLLRFFLNNLFRIIIEVTNFIDNAQILARIERLRADMRTGLGDDNTIWAPMDIDEYIYSYVVGLIG